MLSAQSAAEGEKMELSTFVNTVLRRTFPRHSDQIRFLKKIGFQVFDFSFTSQMVEFHRKGTAEQGYLAEAGQCIRELGITYGQAHSSANNPFVDGQMEETGYQIEQNLKACQFLEIPYLVVHPGMVLDDNKQKFLDRNAKFFYQYVKMAEETGVELLIENIGSPGDPYFVRDGNELRALIDLIGHPMVNACWDVGHANHHRETYSQYDSIIALGDKLKALHLHDNLGSYQLTERCWRADHHMIPLFGSVNYDSVMQGLADIHYKGTLNFEVDAPRIGFEPIPFIYRGQEQNKLEIPPLEIVELTYQLIRRIGEVMLKSYFD